MKSFLLILILAASSNAHAQYTQTFFSPGLKFGYNWGSGVFGGLEFSYSVRTNAYGFSYGVAFNLDLLRSGAYKMHLGVLGGQAVGVQIGPTYVKERGKPFEFGYSGTVYGLVLFMPYYTYTDLFGRTLNETGVLIKIPIQVSGKDFGSLFKT